jgi:hypothetical protein
MLRGIRGGSHLFRQERTEFCTVGTIDGDIGSPLGDMVRRVFRHATSHSGHEPGGAVSGLIIVTGGRKRVVTVGQGVL